MWAWDGVCAKDIAREPWARRVFCFSSGPKEFRSRRRRAVDRTARPAWRWIKEQVTYCLKSFVSPARPMFQVTMKAWEERVTSAVKCGGCKWWFVDDLFLAVHVHRELPCILRRTCTYAGRGNHDPGEPGSRFRVEPLSCRPADSFTRLRSRRLRQSGGGWLLRLGRGCENTVDESLPADSRTYRVRY